MLWWWVLVTSGNRRPGALIGGSIVVAALSSACCWLPLLAVGLGFSAVGFGTIFEQNRLLLLAMAAGFLAGAVILQRRGRHACEGDACPPPRGSGLMLPIVGGIGVLAFAVVPEVIGWTQPDEDPRLEIAGDEHVATYAVNGMTCEGCTSLLVSHLEDQPEIRHASVDYASATARVEFEPNTSAPETIMQRVTDDWEGKYTFDLVPPKEAVSSPGLCPDGAQGAGTVGARTGSCADRRQPGS